MPLHAVPCADGVKQIKPFRSGTALFADVPLSMSIDSITGCTIEWEAGLSPSCMGGILSEGANESDGAM